jgi:hypothetical protein
MVLIKQCLLIVPYSSWSGLNSGSLNCCGQCGGMTRPPQLNVPHGAGGGSDVRGQQCCDVRSFDVRGGSGRLSPLQHRGSSMAGDGIASIAADTMRINGAFKQFKQVKPIFKLFLFKRKCLVIVIVLK